MSPKSLWITCFSFLILCINALFGVPVVTNLDPFFGPSAGGTVVSISGSGFTGTTSVLFGTTPAIFVVNSDSLITATSPLHSPEVVFVTVTTPEGSSLSTPEAYFVYQGNWEVFVSNANSGNVSVIDTTTNVPFVAVIVPSPTSIAIQPNGTKTYVNSTLLNNTVLIDTATHTAAATIPVGMLPNGIAITPDGTLIYVTNLNSSNVSVINSTTNTVIATIPVGVNPSGVAITPDSTHTYVTNSSSQNVSVINTTTNTVIATIPVGITPVVVAIKPDGTEAYVVNNSINNVSVINTATNTVIATVPVGLFPTAIAITPNGNEAYIANFGSSNVSVIDTTTHLVTATIPVGNSPEAILVTPNGMTAYVVNTTTNNVSVINTTTHTVVATISVGTTPVALAITPDGAQIYVANNSLTSNSISVISTATNTVIATVPVGFSPISVEVTPDQAPLAKFEVLTSPATIPSLFDASESISPVGTIVNYLWDFGDGTIVNTLQPIIFHTYLFPGAYVVTLTVTNSAGTSTTQIFNPNSSSIEIVNSVALMNNGGPSATATQMIAIVPAAPIIERINPSSSSTCGGVTVTITGVNFTGTTAVLFGSIPATQFTVVSDTTIIAVAPPGNPGTVDIRVITPFGESAITLTDQFTYLPPSPPRELKGRQIKNHFATQTEILNILTWKPPCGECTPVAYRIYRNHTLTHLAGEVQARQGLEFIDHNRKNNKRDVYFIVSIDRFGHASFPKKIVIRR